MVAINQREMKKHADKLNALNKFEHTSEHRKNVVREAVEFMNKAKEYLPREPVVFDTHW